MNANRIRQGTPHRQTVDVLTRLDRVRETAHGQWVAKCPAHDDRSPSLALRLLDDGRWLVHCFAGCEIEAVLEAMGLTFRDLMPQRCGERHQYAPVCRRFNAATMLAVISREVTVVGLLAARLCDARDISEEEWRRIALAVSRIGAARDAAR